MVLLFKLDTVLAELHLASDSILCLYYTGKHIFVDIRLLRFCKSHLPHSENLVFILSLPEKQYTVKAKLERLISREVVVRRA